MPSRQALSRSNRHATAAGQSKADPGKDSTPKPSQSDRDTPPKRRFSSGDTVRIAKGSRKGKRITIGEYALKCDSSTGEHYWAVNDASQPVFFFPEAWLSSPSEAAPSWSQPKRDAQPQPQPIMTITTASHPDCDDDLSDEAVYEEYIDDLEQQLLDESA